MKRSPVVLVSVVVLASVSGLLLSGDTQPGIPAAGARSPPPLASGPGMKVQHTQLGETIKFQLTSAPFPHPDRRNGYEYNQVQYPANPHYVDSTVAVFVPRGFRPDGPVNLVFFFHGWDSTIDDAQQRFDLYRQFSLSGARALLVLPEVAWNAPDSFGGKLEEKGGFTRLVNELMGALSTVGVIDASPRLGSIMLAGHSGAFEVIALILANGDLAANIQEVCLFDAVYARTMQFAAWIEKRAGRFASVSSADGEETTVVGDLIADLKADGVPYTQVTDDPDSDAQAMSARVVFLQSHSDHYGVVVDQDEFRRLLAASPILAP
jgi:hypothetical protein